MLKFSICVCFLIFSQEYLYAQSNDLKNLIGVTWRLATDAKGTLIFKSPTQLGGHDGCNNYGASYQFSTADGFQVGEMTSTERFCENTQTFLPNFLYQTKSFKVKRKWAFFYDKDKKVLAKLKKQKV